MTEPSGHCPYIGLKQNQSIRFASPTAEHRCYVSGEPLNIPVDQANFCLSTNHVHCPLYMGLSMPTTATTISEFGEAPSRTPAQGLQGWLGTLSQRDRLIYTAILIALMVVITVYLIAGINALLQENDIIGNGPVGEVAVPTTTEPPVDQTDTVLTPVLPNVTEETVLPTPTALPTSTPSPTPSPEPTKNRLYIAPTDMPTTSPDISSTATRTPEATGETAKTPTTPSPTSTSEPLTPTPNQTVATTPITLYFVDNAASLFVPVQRDVQVSNQQIASAAVQELIAGISAPLQSSFIAETQLLDLEVRNQTAQVNFDRYPVKENDTRGLEALVLTLTELDSISRVQVQVNGQNVGIDGTGPIARPVVNPLDPDGLLAQDLEITPLPLYFLNKDGYDVRVMRIVPRTNQTATETIRTLLEGPGSYDSALQRIIPEGTELRGLRIEQGVVLLDFTTPFTNTTDRAAAIHTTTASLFTLAESTGVEFAGVQFLVEGRSLAEYWGNEYGNIFLQPQINPQ
ncbi:MAG: GerMN domain-containing protein [Chloroflexota bacterium]